MVQTPKNRLLRCLGLGVGLGQILTEAHITVTHLLDSNFSQLSPMFPN